MKEEKLRKELLKEILKNEIKFKHNLNKFFKDFIKKLKSKGYQIDKEDEAYLKNYIISHEKEIKTLIEKAIIIAKEGYNIQSEKAKEIYQKVINQRYKDGLNLSERIWRMSDEIKNGVLSELEKSQLVFKGVNNILYDIQYKIEKLKRKDFAIITEKELPKWLKDLENAGRKLIRGLDARKEWRRALREVARQIENLSLKESISAENYMLRQIFKAVETGKEALIDNAIKNWIYDRQLYYLKRLARTEAANAFHRAQIEGTKDLEEIKGYLWKLSPTHPKTDICDDYTRVDYGLGVGVWPKDKVPSQKPHPNCMCYIVPVVS